jgi:hypothetical protein
MVAIRDDYTRVVFHYRYYNWLGIGQRIN